VSRNEIILGVAALILVVFSLVVALVVPRRRPDFPGDRLGLFAFVAIILVAGMLGVVEVYGAEDEEEGGEAAQVEEGGGGDGGGGAAPEGDVANGETIFTDQDCGNCHVLEAAGTSGTVGPSLDERKPSFETAVKQVTEGGGGMPAFNDDLSEQEIRDVAAYVVESAQG
jgi:cytochrome c6